MMSNIDNVVITKPLKKYKIHKVVLKLGKRFGVGKIGMNLNEKRTEIIIINYKGK